MNIDLRELKVIVTGNSGVGKTSLVRCYVDGTFQPDEEPTIGVDFKMRIMKRGNELVKLKIWDTAGLERYQTLTQSFYRGADIAIIVYDINNRDSFTAVKRWYQELETFLTKPHMVKLLVGNKTDLFRFICSDEGRSFACNKEMMFTEACALTKDGVEYMFQIAVDKVLAQSVMVVDSAEAGFSLGNKRTRRQKICKNC